MHLPLFACKKYVSRIKAEKVGTIPLSCVTILQEGGIAMSDQRCRIRDAILYIEDHLTEDLDTRDIARAACLSTFYFQRIFSALCGMGVGEYIRNRRLSLAGQELASTDIRVIDTAAKYGYESPDSFCRAFQRFHGFPPSAAKQNRHHLKNQAPLELNLAAGGNRMLEYKIVEKPQFTLMGMERKFNPETSYQEIPKFWQEVFSRENCPLMGIYGVCLDEDTGDGSFTYLIADNYIPWQDIPAGLTVTVIPASTWAVFPCRGPLPETLQSVNTRMWSEWLPNCQDYRLARNLNIEVYGPPAEKPEDTYSEIWLPLEKI